jgi:NAD(P)-dependent dehydrogenase (short-subunit alcohol dehydrogenase family)
MSVNRFRGRNAIVTGASRGIGAGIAKRLAAEGANLVVVARTIDQHDHLTGSLSETVAHCRQYGGAVRGIASDLSDEESRRNIVPEALETLDGRIDILVNNAAAAIYQPILEFPLRRRRIIFEVNVHAPADLMQAVLPGMRERNEGWIVNVSSAGAKYSPTSLRIADEVPLATLAQSEQGIYGASKAALNRMTKAFAEALTGEGIRVNTIAPRGAVLSEGAIALMGKEFLANSSAESMEAMVEGALILCDCEAPLTGGVHYSLDLLEERQVPVMSLDGATPCPGRFGPFS